MADTQKDYEDLLKLFNRHKVRYCIVGAFALAFHAVPRYTKDMDILIEASSENAQKVLRAVREFGFPRSGLTLKDFSRPGRTVQLGYEPVRIDLLTSIDGCTFEEVWKNRKRGFYGKTRAHFIGTSELVKNKKASNRKQDQADIELLKKIRPR